MTANGWLFTGALVLYGLFIFALLQGWVDRFFLFVRIWLQSKDRRTAIEQSDPQWIPVGTPPRNDWQWSLDPRFQEIRDEGHRHDLVQSLVERRLTKRAKCGMIRTRTFS